MPVEYVVIGAGLLLLVSVIASRASSRLGIPALLLFLIIGMLAGSDGPGAIEFNQPRLAQSLGIVALAFILFAGGLDTKWSETRPVLLPSALLATIGVALTAVLLGAFSSFILNLSRLDGLLLGAVVSSTDAAAVFGILRSKKLMLKGRLRALLELESGSNDPMAIFLTVGLIELITDPTTSVWQLLFMFCWQMAAGAGLGLAGARLIRTLINRIRLEYEGLYPALTVACVLLLYGIAAAVGANGFLSVYVAALALGNSEFLHKQSLIRFHDGVAWLMQITMFLTLGLQVFPSELPEIAAAGIAIAAFLMFVARPAAVFIALSLSGLSVRERLLISWVGLRGAAPIVLATFPLVAGLDRADLIFNVVFLIVIASALVQGTTIPAVSRWLRLTEADVPASSDPLAAIAEAGRQLVDVTVHARSEMDGKRIVDLRLPSDALIVLVGRPPHQQLTPRGSTELHAGDTLLVLASDDTIMQVRRLAGYEKE